MLATLRAENDDLRFKLGVLQKMVEEQGAEIARVRSANQTVIMPPPQDDRIAALEAKLSALVEKVVVPSNGEPKRRGRPPGSKNKPKDPPTEA